MKNLLIGTILMFLSISSSLKGEMPEEMCRMHGMKEGMMPHMVRCEEMRGMKWMSLPHLTMLFSKAENLAPQEVKEKIRVLKNSTIEKIIRQEAEVKIAKIRFKNLLTLPNFKENELKEAFQFLNEQEKKMGEEALISIIKLRDIIGSDIYEKIIKGEPMSKEEMKMGHHKGMSRE